MRRFMLTATASAVVLAIAPASALARHSHHKRHHSRTHHVRHKRFGDISTPPATAPAPTTPGAPPADAVGKVTSFDGTKLTITLNDGTTIVSGAVAPDTQIECEMTQPTSTSTVHMDGDGGGDQSGGGGDHSSSGEHQGQGDDNGQGDDGQDDQGQNANQCTTSNLTPGTFVRGAELKLSSAGAVWDKINLIL
jgi:hypothetical protein